MAKKNELVEYNIKGRRILKCRGMLFTEWCHINGFDYMIDEVDKDYLYETYGLTLDTMTQGFDKKIHWICRNNPSHEMWFKPVHRTNGHWVCPYCNGTSLCLDEHSVEVELPHLLDEWDYERNELKPSEISTGSPVKVWWKCRVCGEGFEQNPYKRKMGQGCPYCRGLKVKKGLNDLFTERPDLEQEWDWEKNTIDPYTITSGSSKKVYWVCKKGHSWQTTVNNRGRSEYQCPFCSSNISFVERAIYFYLCKYFTNVDRQYRLGSYSYDIVLLDEKVLVEFNGQHWHENKEELDYQKFLLAKENGFFYIKIDAVRDRGNIFEIVKETDDILNILCYAEKSNLVSVERLVQYIIDYITYNYYMRRLDLELPVDKDFEIIEKF